MTEPRYQVLKRDAMPVRRTDGAELRLLSGASGELRSSTLNHVPVTMVEIMLQPHARAAPELPLSYNGFLYVIDGRGFFGVERRPAKAGQIVWMRLPSGPDNSEFAVQAAGEPLRAL